MHTTLENVELLKYFKIRKTTPTCFGLQENHHQGATISTQLKITHLVKSRYVEVVQDVVSVMAAYCAPGRRVYRALCEGIPSHSTRYTRLTDHNIHP